MVVPKRALVALAGLQLTGVSADTYFCQFHCKGEDFPTTCREGACPAPGPSCEFFAEQPFVDEDVCGQYQASEPICNGATHQCAEAANFQLVYDRAVDLRRTYSAHDWRGVSLIFHPDSAAFVPGAQSFAFGREAVAAGVRNLHDRTAAENVSAKVRKVLTVRGEPSSEVVHSVGTWTFAAAGQVAADLPFYARWLPLSDGHWVADTLIIETPQSITRVAVGADPLFDAIKARQATFSRLYNAGNVSELVATMYTVDAVIVGEDDALVPQASFMEFLAKDPLGKDVNLDSRIVTRSPNGPAVHEVGFSESTKSAYYARWIQQPQPGSQAEEWVMELHVFAVFPKEAQAEAREQRDLLLHV